MKNTKGKRKEEELKSAMDKVYNIGLKNGSIFMKNQILKSLNRDWTLFGGGIKEMNLMGKILKKINKLKFNPNPKR